MHLRQGLLYLVQIPNHQIGAIESTAGIVQASIEAVVTVIAAEMHTGVIRVGPARIVRVGIKRIRRNDEPPVYGADIRVGLEKLGRVPAQGVVAIRRGDDLDLIVHSAQSPHDSVISRNHIPRTKRREIIVQHGGEVVRPLQDRLWNKLVHEVLDDVRNPRKTDGHAFVEAIVGQRCGVRSNRQPLGRITAEIFGHGIEFPEVPGHLRHGFQSIAAGADRQQLAGARGSPRIFEAARLVRIVATEAVKKLRIHLQLPAVIPVVDVFLAGPFDGGHRTGELIRSAHRERLAERGAADRGVAVQLGAARRNDGEQRGC